MSIKIVLAKAHQDQIKDDEIKKELFSVEKELNKANLLFNENAINFVFIKGVYLHKDRKMITACLFVNKTDKSISELHGVLKLKFKDRNAILAKTTINFDEPFIGSLNPEEALLVHIGIPVKGLTEDDTFAASDITGVFDDVRVTFS